MNKINENQFEKIKNSKIELKPKTQKQGEKTMKNLKKVNYKKIIETVKTIIIYTAIVAGLAFYFGMRYVKATPRSRMKRLRKQLEI